MPMPVMPIAKNGMCPSGYNPQDNMCVPGSSAKPAIAKNGMCPSGYSPQGNYCVASRKDAPMVIPKSGMCPSGYSPQGNYCVESNFKRAGKSSSSGKCFIATATMGDYDHPVVMQLREFRDQYLLERNWGRKFTRYYYKWGPYPAKIISKSNLLKKVSYVFIVQPLSFVVQKIMNKN